MEEVLFKSEEKKSRSDIAAFLHRLADKIESGNVVLRQADAEKQVDLPEQLVMEVKLEREQKKGREKMSLEVELEWIPGESGDFGVSLG